MTAYPAFIPIYYDGGGSGGSGGPFKPKGLLIIVGLLGVVYGGIIYTVDYPRFKMRMDRGYLYRKSEVYVELIHTNKFPNIVSVEHKGLDCMKRKGYNIKVDNTTDDVRFRGTLTYRQIMEAHATTGGNIDGDDFLSDCKECGVTTEIKYMDTRYITNNHSYGKRTFKWHRCSLPELK